MNNKKERETKFNVSKNIANRTYDDIVFDSALEMKFYRDYIVPKVNNGEIVSCERQKPYILQPSFKYNNKTILAIKYVADFVITFADGNTQVIDVKGFADSVANIKKKMFYYHFPNVDYIWMGFSKIDGGWLKYEDIQKARKLRKKKKTKE